ncbi:MAG: Bax inhibitor-1/YccA family protein [Methylotetracoccus sp.]|nr:Bax inhibitor-1/YccA family protein [Methylotetracoccus sp.]
MNQTYTVVRRAEAGLLATHKVLRNTYGLLAMTLLFSAAAAAMSMVLNLPHPGVLVTLVGYFGLLWLTNKFSRSAWGLVWVFALTGFMGMTLGPILNVYLSHFANGGQLVMTALGGTGVIFVGLSAYALMTRKDFGFMAGMLTAGILVAFLAGLAALFLPTMPGLHVAVSAMFILLMSGLILFQTSEIIHGGETNYILATVTLYVSIFNLFTSLLQLLGIFSGDD